jgi:transposase, IS5 family
MIEMRRAQLSFGDGLIVEEVSDLREDWMKHADAVLSDEDIVAAVYDALARRHAAAAAGEVPRPRWCCGC